MPPSRQNKILLFLLSTLKGAYQSGETENSPFFSPEPSLFSKNQFIHIEILPPGILIIQFGCPAVFETAPAVKLFCRFVCVQNVPAHSPCSVLCRDAARCPLSASRTTPDNLTEKLTRQKTTGQRALRARDKYGFLPAESGGTVQ